MVSCENLFFKKVYSNVHAIISLRNMSKKNSYKRMVNPSSTLSVLLVGIDSISKLNLMRAMPKTFNFLEHGDFVNLKGYTKVGLNTLPNLLGMLSGRTRDQAKDVCDVNNSIDDCPFIWEKFKELNYITGYGEDSTSIGSFNYLKKGFAHPPTDFYFRPYVLAAERLKIINRGGMTYCTGPETSAERIMNLAKDFQITLKNYPKFGLFWMNSFSHDNLNMPSAMDEKVKEFLSDLSQHLNNTVFFFFSDHGFRFGKIRNTQTGWLEERIPFFYVHFPESFKRKFPQLYGNFQINSERLTNAFDIYMTLQHLLFLADSKFAVEESVACPKCHSLFDEVSDGRTCEDAAIEENWCVCNVRTYINPKKERVQKAALFLVKWINEMIETFPEGDRCHRYQLDKVIYSGISRFTEEGNRTGIRLLLRVKTRPSATFESSLELPSNVSNLTFRVMGDVSRLNRYAPYTKCLNNSQLEKHCYCKDALKN